MDLGIAGRKAIVCASSRGLGYGCAMALAREGCEVVINGRDEKRLLVAADEIAKATGAKVIPVAADVASPEGQKALFAACPEPDILVNNNAGPPMRDFRELSREQIVDGVIANMAVAIELIQKAIDPMMEKKFGRIVNITSVVGQSGNPGQANYSAAKAGLIGLTKSLAQEVASEGIRVNAVRPGVIYTDIHASGGEPARVDRVKASVPMRRGGRPEEVAHAIVWLLSDEASFTTGAILDVAGGR